MVDEDERTTDASVARRARPDEEETARDPRSDTRLGPGADIGGYIVDGEVGKGGMGFVYSATHPVIGKRAAIKVLKPEVSKSPIVVERFIQEARAVNQIGHPNIVDIFAFGILPDGRAYHIMDLLEGESLRRRLRKGPLHPSEAASVIEEIASALTAAHDKGFVHRDLKPDNVFLVEHEGRWPEVKLLDFGLAKLMPEAGTAPFQTKTGVMLGTPEYMSPEQARGIGVDYRTDVYALGVLTFEILAGVRPFPSLGDSFATLQAHAEEPPPSLADLVPTLPVELVQLVAAMLAKDPAARPSLAAVRTVIKRLRTTQLPSRTVAGLEALSLPPQAPPSGPLDAVRPSRLGAAPVLPGDLESLPAEPPPPVVPRTFTPARPVNPSQLFPQQPPQRPSSNSPAASTHGGGSGSSPSMRILPYPGAPAAHPIAPVASPSPLAPPGPPVPPPGPPAAPVPQASGLAGPGPAPIAGTVLGVGVPAMLKSVRTSAPSSPPTSPAAAPPPATPASPAASGQLDHAPGISKLWLVLGALLFIGAGIALAMVLA